MTTQRTALISVYNKDGLAEFAQQLHQLGFQLLASGGTAGAIKAAGLPVRDVADLVGGEAILGHRVVTLSREVHAGLLARQIEDDLAELESLGVPFIDLVCVDCYPLATEIAKPEATMDSVIEQTDIGGPTMLRSGAKASRIVICEHADRQRVISWLKDDQPNADKFVADLTAKAEGYVASYCLDGARYRSGGNIDGMIGTKFYDCRYGENPWQADCVMFTVGSDDPLALDKFQIIAGKGLGRTNWTDVDRLLQTMTHTAAVFDNPNAGESHLAFGAKHGNCCGGAYAYNSVDAIKKMVTGNPLSIFGGSVMVNFPITDVEAIQLLSHAQEGRRLLDVIVAPAVDHEALKVLRRAGGRCQILVNPELAKLDRNSLDQAPQIRQVRGGFIIQPNYTYILDLHDREVLRPNPCCGNIERDLMLAWAIGCTSNSNTIVLVKNGQLLGSGVCQMDRVGAAKLAVERAQGAKHDIAEAVAYSDSFFPFVDGPEVLVKAGVRAILTCGGSKGDEAVRQYCIQNEIDLYMVPVAMGRGFFGH
jgi:phosphoribosylaminoimidazolecarboxamide formyltransferase / IMP cyclohydrolase